MTKILLIAPLNSGASNTNVIGGHRLLAEESVRELGQRGFVLEVLDTSGDVTNISPWRFQVIRLARFLLVIQGVVMKIRRSQVAFLVIAPHSALVLASSIWAICRMAHRPLVMRLSGGDLGLVYDGYGPVARCLAERTWMRCSLVYVETRQSYRNFEHRPNFRWFPGTRNVQAPAMVRRAEIRKLIFFGRLHMTKGLAEALNACRHLPEPCHLQVFGPGMSDTDWSLFEAHPKATYGGVLEPEDVPRVLSEHDLLLFPSYYPGEGYPGVILEAFQCGPARHRRKVARRSGACQARRERAARGAPIRWRGAVRHQAVAGRPRSVPAALRGRQTPGRRLPQREMARPHGCGPARPVADSAQRRQTRFSGCDRAEGGRHGIKHRVT